MSSQLPAILISVPLLMSLIVAAMGWMNSRLCFPLTLLGLGVACFSSIKICLTVIDTGVIHYHLGGWLPPVGIEYRIDSLNALVLVVITTIALLNLISAKEKVKEEFPDRMGSFFALYGLFVTGLMGITITGDAFNLYVLLEITALTGYALLGMGRKHAALASLNYVFMGTIGASFYLLGVGYLYLLTGSLNMADLSVLLPKLYQSNVLLTAFLLCLTGLLIKMAFFPLHTWLPNAYSYSPSAAIGLIAPLTTKVMVYAMIRVALSVFTPAYAFSFERINNPLVWLASSAIVMGSVLALAQKDLLRMLSYIVVAEIGYMVGGFWIGNSDGITGAILHIANDAAMTLCLFLAVGNIRYRTKHVELNTLGGLFKKMPLTLTAFIIGGVSIIGVPPTCGFFSKWYLIKGGLTSNHYEFVGALIFSSLVNVVLFFRIVEIGFFTTSDAGEGRRTEERSITEAPFSMLLPLMISAISIIILGIYTNDIVTRLIAVIVPNG